MSLFFKIIILSLFTVLNAQEQLGSDIDGEAADDASGYRISMSSNGDRVGIAAYSYDGGGSNSGHVRVYEYSGGSWSQLGSDIDGNNAGDAIGSSVPLDSDGDRLAIGSEYTDCGAMAFKKLRNKK